MNKLFFSATARGFYSSAIHGQAMPADVKEISLELYQTLQGQEIAVDANGLPCLASSLPVSIEKARADKNEEINQARLSANFSTFPHAGKWFACDQLSRGDIDAVANHISLFSTFPPDFPGKWKAIDNTYIDMQDIESFKAFYASMTAQGTANFNKAQALKMQLAAANTKAKIAAIKWE